MTNNNKGDISQFIDTYFLHFNAATLVDASKAYIEQFDTNHTLAVLHRFFEASYIQEFIDNNVELLSSVPLYVLTESEYIRAYQTKNWDLFSEKQVL